MSTISSKRPGRFHLSFADFVSRHVGRMKTIRSQILVACLAMSVVTATLGVFATLGVRHVGDLVTKTYDKSLMSISFARAASADFATMRAAYAMRLLATDENQKRELDKKIAGLAKSLSEDLTIAAERSQSQRARRSADLAQAAASNWIDAQRHRSDASEIADPALSSDADFAKIVDDEIELLVNYTAGDGFLFRQRALAEIQKELRFNVAGLIVALLLSGVISWLLARRILGPVSIASTAAKRIAEGDLNTSIPLGGRDELGSLLTAMGVMRDKIRAMVEREVVQRRSAQARLRGSAGKLERRRRRARCRRPDRLGEFAGQRHPRACRSCCFRIPCSPPSPTPNRRSAQPARRRSGPSKVATDVQLPDGRWLRVSRGTTQEGGEIVVCSDISVLKRQKVELRASNLLLDAALANMSQGLCLYDRDNRLRVVNRRFYEIFELSPDLILTGKTFPEVLQLSVSAGNRDNEACQTFSPSRSRP